MVFVFDAEGEFDAPLADVWRFLSSGKPHSAAHRHRAVRRRVLSDRSGTYSWSPAGGPPARRVSMRWEAYPPVGLAYEITEGSFAGSRFFLVYVPRGPTTGVVIAGEFVSPTLPVDAIEPEVRSFFDREFREDAGALRRWLARSRSAARGGRSASREARRAAAAPPRDGPRRGAR